MTQIFAWKKEWTPDIEAKFRLRSNSLVSQSGINPGAPDIYGPQAQVWVGNIPIGDVERREWQRIDAWFGRVAGISGLVRMFDPKHIRPGRDIPRSRVSEPWSDGTLFSDGTGWGESSLPPYVVVYEAAAAGETSILVTGLPASNAPCLWAGDRFEVRPNGVPADHGHYYQVSYDANSNASGRARIEIAPGLRRGVAVGDMVALYWPTSVYRLIDDEQGQLSHLLGGIASTGFALIEVIPS